MESAIALAPKVSGRPLTEDAKMWMNAQKVEPPVDTVLNVSTYMADINVFVPKAILVTHIKVYVPPTK